MKRITGVPRWAERVNVPPSRVGTVKSGADASLPTAGAVSARASCTSAACVGAVVRWLNSVNQLTVIKTSMPSLPSSVSPSWG